MLWRCVRRRPISRQSSLSSLLTVLINSLSPRDCQVHAQSKPAESRIQLFLTCGVNAGPLPRGAVGQRFESADDGGSPEGKGNGHTTIVGTGGLSILRPVVGKFAFCYSIVGPWGPSTAGIKT